jgi:AraC-like DNA-binding protein
MPAEYVPTADQRALVENDAAFGITQADIAEQLGIQEKTLRKHFRRELNVSAIDIIRAQSLAPLPASKKEKILASLSEAEAE